MKTKINIPVWIFYLQIAVVGIFILFLTVHIISDLSNNTINAQNRAIANGHLKDSDEYNSFVNEVVSMTIKNWIIQYIVSCVLVIGYLIYCLFAISRIEISYLFVGFWLCVWIGFAIAPPLLNKTFVWYDIIDIILFIIVFSSMFFVVKELQTLKKINQQKKFKTQLKKI